MNSNDTKNEIKSGLMAGVPIGLGYLAVSFAFGIAAAKCGIKPVEALVMSVTNLTSAGQFAGIDIIAAGASFGEMALTQLIINLRYFLMACSLSQKIDSNTSIFHRLLMSYGITDEIFGVSACREKQVTPAFFYAMVIPAVIGWGGGTFLGEVSGNILPANVISALGIAIYGMFLAVIIPPSKKSNSILLAVVVTMALSYIFSIAPVLKSISSGFKIIILTVLVAGGAAILKPVDNQNSQEGAQNE